MRFRIQTLQTLIALSAAPIWAICEGEKAGCADWVIFVWGAFVAAPLLLMGLVLACVRKDHVRESVIGFFGAIAIVGYLMAIPGSLVAIDLFSP